MYGEHAPDQYDPGADAGYLPAGTSHIIATDFDTMINVVDSIKTQEAELDDLLDQYGDTVMDDDKAAYNELMENYAQFKHAVVNVVAFSANSKTADAYACANGDLASYGNAMQQNIDTITADISTQADAAKTQLSTVYAASLVTNTVTIIISIGAILFAVISVLRGIVKPITYTEREISGIIRDIDNREGDLNQQCRIEMRLRSARSAWESIPLWKNYSTFSRSLRAIQKRWMAW